HGEVGPRPARLDEEGEVARVVREVGVHLADVVEASREGELEPGEVGRPEPLLTLPLEEPDAAGVRVDELADEVGRPVGRAVVDDEGGELAGLRHHLLEQGRDVLRLVVGRDDDDGAGGAAGGQRGGGSGGRHGRGEGDRRRIRLRRPSLPPPGAGPPAGADPRPSPRVEPDSQGVLRTPARGRAYLCGPSNGPRTARPPRPAPLSMAGSTKTTASKRRTKKSASPNGDAR